MNIFVEIAPGELIDKITILEIKLENISDDAKLANIRYELGVLTDVYRSAIAETEELRALIAELKDLNRAIWRIEDRLHERERIKDFGGDFVTLARSAYTTNDRRAAVKREINRKLNSRIVEEKSFSK